MEHCSSLLRWCSSILMSFALLDIVSPLPLCSRTIFDLSFLSSSSCNRSCKLRRQELIISSRPKPPPANFCKSQLGQSRNNWGLFTTHGCICIHHHFSRCIVWCWSSVYRHLSSELLTFLDSSAACAFPWLFVEARYWKLKERWRG